MQVCGPVTIREELFTRLTTPTKSRDAVISQKEGQRVRDETETRCIKTHKIKHWSARTLIDYIKTTVPEAHDTRLAECSSTICSLLTRPVNKFALDFQGLVRALAFLTGRMDQVYAGPKTKSPNRWISQLSRRPDEIISETIFRSMPHPAQSMLLAYKPVLEYPDKDILDALKDSSP